MVQGIGPEFKPPVLQKQKQTNKKPQTPGFNTQHGKAK
jgi:hypothetical protein